jgi:hypothetical protein
LPVATGRRRPPIRYHAEVRTSSWLGLLALAVVGGAAPRAADANPVQLLRDSYERFRSEVEALEHIYGELTSVLEGSEVKDAKLLAALYLNSNQPTGAEVDLTASAGAGSQGRAIVGDVAVSARARVLGNLCDLAEVGALARASASRELRSGGGADGAAELQAWGNACLPRGITLTGDQINAAGEADDPDEPPGFKLPSSFRLALFPVRFNGSVAINASPSLSSKRNDPLRTYSEVGYGFAVEGLRMSFAESNRGVSFIFASLQQRWEWAGLPGNGDAGYEISSDVGPLRLYKVRGPEALADRSIDFFVISLHGVRFAASSGLIDLYPVRLTGIGLLGERVLVDASLGLVASGATIGSSDAGTITPDPRIAKVTTAGGTFALAAGTAAQGWGLIATRTLDTNVLAQLTLENRGTAWTQLSRDSLRARGEAFAGNARHFFDHATSGRERFVGAKVTVDYAVRDQLWLGVRAEGVESFARDAILQDTIAGSSYRALATMTWTRVAASHAL